MQGTCAHSNREGKFGLSVYKNKNSSQQNNEKIEFMLWT